MASQQLFEVSSQLFAAYPAYQMRGQSSEDVAKRYDGILPYWSNHALVTSDYLSASGDPLLSKQAIELMRRLGGVRFKRVPAVLFQHPKWKTTQPPWDIDGPAPTVRTLAPLKKLPRLKGYSLAYVPRETALDYIDWSVSKYRNLSSKERDEELARILADARLIEPRGGFPPVFVVRGFGGELLCTAEGKDELSAQLQLGFEKPEGVGSVQWRKIRGRGGAK